MNEAGPSAIESADEKKPKSGGGRQRGKLKSEDKSNDAAGQKKPKSKRGRSRSDTKSEDKSNNDSAGEKKPKRKRSRPRGETKSEDKSNYDAANEKPKRRRGRLKVSGNGRWLTCLLLTGKVESIAVVVAKAVLTDLLVVILEEGCSVGRWGIGHH